MTDLRRNTAEITEALKKGESIELTHHNAVIGRIVPADQDEPEQYRPSHPVFEQMGVDTRRIADGMDQLLRLVEHYQPKELEVADSGRCTECGNCEHDHGGFRHGFQEPDLPTAAWDSTQAPPEDGWKTAGYTTDEGPEKVLREADEPKGNLCECGQPMADFHEAFMRGQCIECYQAPVQRPEPTSQQLAYAQDFYGLQQAAEGSGWALTEKGLSNATSTMRQKTRKGDELASEMNQRQDDDPDRLEYLLLLQVEKYQQALDRFGTDEGRWIPGAP